MDPETGSILDGGGTVDGRTWLEEVGHWDPCSKGRFPPGSFLLFSLLPVCREVDSSSHHGILPPLMPKAMDPANLELKPLKP